MLLAEALTRKKDLKNMIAGLQNEVLQNNIVIEGEGGDVDVILLVNQAGNLLIELGTISINIDRTNHATIVDPPESFLDGFNIGNQCTLADLLVMRRFTDKNLEIVKRFYDNSGKAGIGGYALPDVKRHNLLQRETFRVGYSALCEERRKIEAQIQSINWTTKLITSS